MFETEAFTLPGALALQAAFTFYYIYFIIRPLSEIEKISGRLNYGYRLLFLRTTGIIIVDMINPTLGAFIDISLLFTLAFFTVPKIKKELNYVQSIDTKLASYDELTAADLSAHGFSSRKALEQNLFKKLVAVQTARSKYDYESLKSLCTEELYNIFISELEVLEEADLGYHFKNYKMLESQIYSLTSDEHNMILKVAIKASCISYRLSKKGEVVDGSKTDNTIIIHELEFNKKVKIDDLEENCKNCGAPTKRNSKNKCQYCDTIIDGESTDWLLAENKVVAEKIVKKKPE